MFKAWLTSFIHSRIYDKVVLPFNKLSIMNKSVTLNAHKIRDDSFAESIVF